MTQSVALVTGATGGIGKEIARGLVGAGTHVIVGARTPSRGEATAEELSAHAAVCERIERESKGNCVWLRLAAAG